jgi:hypothetical protein
VTGSLPAWLHAVTRRVAANLRRNARRRSEVEAAARPPEPPTDDPSLREGLAVLDEELARLPERYRAVLIVCCLEGRSRDEAAVQLGWSEGQVKGRLERARELLRTRLARRGVELGGLLLAATVAGPIPARADPPSAAALTLTNGVIRAMTIQKVKLAVVLAACAGVALAGGVALRAHPGDPAGPNSVATAPTEPPNTRVGAAGPKDKGNPPRKEPGESAKKVKDLRTERVATLKELVALYVKLYQSGRGSHSEVLEAQMLLLRAELDAAETEAERVTLYQKAVDAMKTFEGLARAQREAGLGTQAAVLRLRASRLEVEIQLEQAKMKVAKEGR